MSAPGKYRVLHELGAGGMGRIYKGLLVGQAGFQRPIVIKRLRESGDSNHLRLFVAEARRYAVLDHENIGRIFDFEEVAGQASIILEYIDGWSVAEYLERHRQLHRLPDVDLSVFIASRVCRALQYVFERVAIVHRDISPGNIMMTREGAVKLIDFGIAALSGSSDGTLTGKPAYMAPEMVLELRADHRSDLFSLGVVLFEMLTLERLFPGATAAEVFEQVVSGQCASPRQYNPTIPDSVMGLLDHALQRDPARRFASAEEMGAQCEHILYDKGYGPTNLTLKHELGELFPETRPATIDAEPTPFPLLDPALIPIDDGTPPSRAPGATTRVARREDGAEGQRTASPGTTRRARPPQRPR
jgi:eukaryotic-like serine/threonine-protein kinase